MTFTRRGILKTAAATGLAGLFMPSAARAGEDGAGACVLSSVDCHGAHADALVEFISVQAQVNRGNPVWNRPQWRPLLGALGVRYIRGNLAGKRARDHMLALNAQYGIRACALVTSVRRDGSFDFDKAAAIVDFMRDEIGPGAIRAFEGPNEYTKNHKSDGWAGRLRDYQEFLFRRIRNDPSLKTIPLLAPTIWQRKLEDYRAIAPLGRFCDHGNLHLYSGGRRPSLFGWEGKDESVDRAIDDARGVAPDRRICVSETGFRTAGIRPTAWDLPPEVVAKYTLRNITGMFLRRRDVAWMNIYTLMDYSAGSDYGLLDTDLTPRPAYFALRNLIRIVADPGPAIQADERIAFRLLAGSPALRSLALHKRDGRSLLLLWCDADSYDRRARNPVRIAPQPATVDFGGRRIGSLRLYMPTRSGMPVEERSGITSAGLQVTDDLLIAEMTP